ncbi:DNA-binding protein [Bacillus cereus group sp. BfR-BA-01380]|uniref:DNA-binding protein n=1 Tax=Bacillus cereus group sp. BfR-BA-01380 TaxID=2920324 RepID=UPI001F581034|nr:DNA-binding protein [Bacillus cereus group sp. BfR-BA-01380]
MKEIDKYMSPSEAAARWNIAETTLKNYLQDKINDAVSVGDMIERGYLKYHIKPGGKRKEWIISVDAINIWFPNKKQKEME